MKILIQALGVLLFTTLATAKEYKAVVLDFLPIDGQNSSGKFAGVQVELTEAVCKKLKYTCKFELLPIRRAEEMMAKGEADFMLGLAVSPQRKEIGYFSPMLTSSAYTFFAKAGAAKKYKALADVAGSTVGVHGPSGTQRSLESLNAKVSNKIKIEMEPVTDVPFKKLAGDRYGDNGLVYSNRAVGTYMVQKMKIPLEPVSFDTEKLHHGVLLSKKSFTADEYKKVWTAFKEVMDSPEGKKIYSNWPVDKYDGPAESAP